MPNSIPSRHARLRVKCLAAGAVAALTSACGGGGGGGGSGGAAPTPGTSTPQPPQQPVAGITLVAGDPVEYGFVDGKGGAARFAAPTGLAVDAAGNLYVADQRNAVIRKVTPDGQVSTFAGTNDGALSSDGTGAGARFQQPAAMTIDAAGNLYVTDLFQIRKITPAGGVTTLYTVALGEGNERSWPMFVPGGVAVDGAGNLYITTPIGTRRVSPLGVVTMLEGAATLDNVFGTRLPYRPRAVAVDGNGMVWVNDMADALSRTTAAGTGLTIVAGAPNQAGHADGKGAAVRFGKLVALAPDKAGNLYAADAYNEVIRKIAPDGTVTTVAGKPDPNALANLAATVPIAPLLQTGALPGSFAPLGGLALDGKGNLYATSGNAVVKITLP